MTRSRSITSAKNPFVQRCRAAAQGDDAGLMFAEGVRLCAEGLDAGLTIVAVATSPRLRDVELGRRLSAVAAEAYECSDVVLARLSAVETHQGIAALFQRPRWRPADLLRRSPPLVVVAAGVRDPGNLGALVRTAEAAGAAGLIALAGGADPFRDKAVRAAMGSVFRLPVLAGLTAAEVVSFTRTHSLQLVAADGGGGIEHSACDLRPPTALVLGAEAAGVPGELLGAASARVRIALEPPVESLNVAVAAGVLLFEARRQRR